MKTRLHWYHKVIDAVSIAVIVPMLFWVVQWLATGRSGTAVVVCGMVLCVTLGWSSWLHRSNVRTMRRHGFELCPQCAYSLQEVAFEDREHVGTADRMKRCPECGEAVYIDVAVRHWKDVASGKRRVERGEFPGV